MLACFQYKKPRPSRGCRVAATTGQETHPPLNCRTPLLRGHYTKGRGISQLTQLNASGGSLTGTHHSRCPNPVSISQQDHTTGTENIHHTPPPQKKNKDTGIRPPSQPQRSFSVQNIFKFQSYQQPTGRKQATVFRNSFYSS